jgi:hypothetical protein
VASPLKIYPACFELFLQFGDFLDELILFLVNEWTIEVSSAQFKGVTVVANQTILWTGDVLGNGLEFLEEYVVFIR